MKQHPHGKVIIVTDNAPAHTAKFVKEFVLKITMEQNCGLLRFQLILKVKPDADGFEKGRKNNLPRMKLLSKDNKDFVNNLSESDALSAVIRI